MQPEASPCLRRSATAFTYIWAFNTSGALYVIMVWVWERCVLSSPKPAQLLGAFGEMPLPLAYKGLKIPEW
ncbi:hypothetical protein XENTR_v10016975 [Xenopus tropicalis]|nr:hypothetical protein XENTR_v10016975 [Xenopus tropicalis]